MNIQIHPDTTFSTGNAARMLGIEGISTGRIKLLCDKGLVPFEKTSGGAYRIKFGDFPKIVEAHEQVRTVNKGDKDKHPTMEQFNALVDRVSFLEDLIAEPKA